MKLVTDDLLVIGLREDQEKPWFLNNNLASWHTNKEIIEKLKSIIAQLLIIKKTRASS